MQVDRSKWVLCTSKVEGNFAGFKTLTGVTIEECDKLPFDYIHIESNIEVEGSFNKITVSKGTIICYLKD